MFSRRYYSTPFERTYECYSSSFIDKPELENGDNVIMPPSALDHLASIHTDNPMVFELYNPATQCKTHCGVLEFVAEEGTLYMPYWMMQNMLLQEGDTVQIKSTALSKGTYVKFRPDTMDLFHLSNPKAVLEKTLRSFTCLSTGDCIMISHNNKKYYLDILETKPASSISIIDTDCDIDIALPSNYKEMQGQKLNQEKKFVPFMGKGRKVGENSASQASRNSMMSIKESEFSSKSSTRLNHAPKGFSSFSQDVAEGLPREDSKKATQKVFQPFTGRRYSLRE
ncbi:ubiquitin fusion degradation protein 1 homolog isoform X1 [Amborella trichopoda]|nr:ubiquitin fusion degradation protein 1 homolog isoform X1 [Amborella trichopoda]|eukprot:XP_011628022.1 ubiquitin fusion degradation protein 1 homolog isoform X1 [Amborella trichopoda]